MRRDGAHADARDVPHDDRQDRGSTTLELVVWAPGLLLLIGLLVVAGRVNSANGAVEQAAVDAARTASSERTATDARNVALSPDPPLILGVEV